MALIIDLMQTYDQSAGLDTWIADGIHQISPTDTPLQLLLPKIQMGSTNPLWVEDTLTGLTSALTTSVNSTATTINITTGDGADKLPNDVATYNTILSIDQEYVLATGTATDLITVTRGYASTTAASHDSAAVIHIVSQLEHEGADGKKPQARARTKPSNYMQTFSRTVEISGVEEAVKKLGGVTSEMDYQITQAMRHLALELEKTIIMGVAAQVGDGSSSFRHMGGLWAMVATNRSSDSGSIDTDAIEEDIQTIWDAGGNPTAMVVPGAMAQSIANLWGDRVRTDITNTIGGVNITSILNPLGAGLIAIIPHRMLRAGEYYMLDTSRIALGYLRPFFMKDLADDGDADKRWIGGDYTLELLNETAHTYRYGFS